MDEGLLRQFLGLSPMAQKAHAVPYQTMATRGCPHSCTYCCNHLLRKLYGGERYLRRRSPEKIVRELVRMIGRYGFIERVTFSDDSFFAAGEEEIARFAEMYRKEVALPFFCLGSPLTITASKLDSLVSAGMVEIQMGIQSASARTLALYNRKIPADLTERAAVLINRHRERVMPIYDFLLDNPYERPADVVETLRFILRLPRPYILQPFSLVLFPGTVLYDRAKEDGLLADERSDVYRKQFHIRASSYLNLMFLLLNHGFPRPLMRLLLSGPLLWAFNRRAFNPLYAAVLSSFRRLKGLLCSKRKAHRPDAL
jgi:anaerobic magnesium-protoporphyrin IX monomethyl ester cyclase